MFDRIVLLTDLADVTREAFAPLARIATTIQSKVWIFHALRGSSELFYLDGEAAKLQSIIIPKLELDEATIAQAVAFLRKRSQELDPDGEGVNILLQLAPAAPDAKNAKGGAAAPPTISLSLNRVPLSEVIRYVCMQADLKFSVESNAVIIADKIMPIGEMQTRAYTVKPGVFETVETKPRKHLTDK